MNRTRNALVGAVKGLGIGLGTAIVFWWLKGAFIGMTMDYEFSRHYVAEKDFVDKVVVFVPLFTIWAAYSGYRGKRRGPYS